MDAVERAALREVASAATDVAEALWRLLEDGPPLALYSQRDPRWRDLEYAGGKTFGEAGCYVVSVAMMLSLASYGDDPPMVAGKLVRAGCFDGALLTRPERIPDAYPRMRYGGTLRWHGVPADMERVRRELDEHGPTIMEADFRPGGPFNQHFFVAEAFSENGKDIWIADPFDGACTLLMQRYAGGGWDLARAVYGMRLLRAAK